MTVRTQKHEEVFRTRAISQEVAKERGYRRYGGSLGLDPIFEADSRYETESIVWKGNPLSSDPRRRMSTEQTLKDWIEKKTDDGTRTGWIMPKHALPGSEFLAPLAQLRPDVPVPGGSWAHLHAELPAADLARHLANSDRAAEHAFYGSDADKLHTHYDAAKYLLPPGPHGKRWDTHPRCTPDRFLAAERVFLHLEGTLKLDALVSAGEVGADVPSVTMWDRREALSQLDWPNDSDDSDDSDASDVVSFFDAWRKAEDQRILQQDDLIRFLDAYVRAPVIVVCDRDWRDNPQVSLEAFSLRDAVRDAGFECVVAAPPGASKGSDDFLFRGGKVDNLQVIEPFPHKAPGRAEFNREYRRTRRYAGASGRRRPAKTIDQELALLDWYAINSAADGRSRRPVRRIAKRLGVDKKTVWRGTLALQAAGALVIEGHYHDPDEPTDPEYRRKRGDRALDAIRRKRLGRRPPPATIHLRKDLIPERWTPTVRQWVESLK